MSGVVASETAKDSEVLGAQSSLGTDPGNGNRTVLEPEPAEPAVKTEPEEPEPASNSLNRNRNRLRTRFRFKTEGGCRPPQTDSPREPGGLRPPDPPEPLWGVKLHSQENFP